MKLIIPKQNYIKMVRYTHAVEGEISGLADVEWDEKKENLLVGNIYLLRQKATTGTVELLEEAVHKFMFELIKQGVMRTPRLWWHSHYDFQPFFSGVDEDTIDKLQTDSFTVAICINREGKMEAKVKLVEGTDKKIINDLNVVITPPLEESFEPTKEIMDEVKEKVLMEKESWIKTIVDKITPTKKRQVMCLPRKKDKAIEVIRNKKLIESFDEVLHEWVFEHQNGDIYRVQEGSNFAKFCFKR